MRMPQTDFDAMMRGALGVAPPPEVETDDPAIIRVCDLTGLPTKKEVVPGEDGQPMYRIRVELK